MSSFLVLFGIDWKLLNWDLALRHDLGKMIKSKDNSGTKRCTARMQT